MRHRREEGGALKGVATLRCEAQKLRGTGGEEGGPLEGAMTSSREAQGGGGWRAEGSGDVTL